VQEKLWPEIVAEKSLQVTPEGPDSESEMLPVTVTNEPFTKAPLAGLEMLIEGGVISRLIVVLVADEFPAESVAAPETD
jgi:hypothetical protein